MLSDYQRYRFYEMLPGISIWLTLILSIVLSFWKPLWVIYGILVFDVYWVLRILYYSFYLILSWRRFHRAVRIDWMKKLKTDFPDWEKNQNVVFLPLANETYDVVESTLKALLASSLPADKLIVVLSGEARRQTNWDNVQTLVKQNFSNFIR